MIKNTHEIIREIIATSKPDGIVTKVKHNVDIWSYILTYTSGQEFCNKAEQIYFVAHELKSKPACKCGNSTKFVSLILGYREFCSSSCEFAKIAATERRIKKMQENGGVGLANPKSREKAQKTLQRIHGDDVVNPGQIKSHREMMQENNPMFEQSSVDKLAKTIESKYGKFKKNPVHIFLNDQQCEILTNASAFAELVKGRTIGHVAEETGLDYNTILRHVRKHNLIDTIVFNPRSLMEEDMKLWLNEMQIPYKHDDRTILEGNRELDFFLKEYNFAIELHGLWHHSEIGGKKEKKYHFDKFQECKNKGIQLLQIWQDEYWKSKSIIQSKILYLVNRNINRIHARKCEISHLKDAPVEREFLEKNHIQGFAAYRQISFSATYDSKIVGIMSFSHRKDNTWEIVRFATDIKTHIPGLFSKILKYSVKSGYICGDIISFSDNRISNGNLYIQSGFELASELDADYCYTNDYQTRHNKQGFRKEDLIKNFNLDSQLVKETDEWTLMKELGYDRLWDAGKIKWKINSKSLL
jgi:hypothetical protein